MDIKVGSILWNRYECIEQIKEEVYVLRDLRVNKQKRILKVSKGQAYMQQATQEVNILTTINHPAIPKVMDYGYCSSSLSVWVIYDFIAGQTLEEWMANREYITYQQLLHIAEQLVSICNALHQLPIPVIHRDIKPSNMMINEQGFVYLIDFGIATWLAREEIVDTTFWGTVGFAAPEQYPDASQQNYTLLDITVDLYSVGAVLDWILVTMYKQLEGTALVREGKKLRHIPDALYQLIEELLARNKQYRLPSMELVYERIKQLQINSEEEPIDDKTQSPFTIVIASLNRGAGATFLSQLLAELLASKQQVIILDAGAEGGQAQWMSGNYQWDPSSSNDPALYQLFHGQQLAVQYYAKINRLPYEHKEQLIVEELQQQIAISTIAASGKSVLIVDMSSRPHDHLWRYWIKHANHLIVVGDPFLASWSHAALTTYSKLLHSKQSNEAISFIANKWMEFTFEQQWLSFFPDNVIGKLPYIEMEKRLAYSWSSKWITTDVVIRKKMKKVLQPLLKRLQNEHNTS